MAAQINITMVKTRAYKVLGRLFSWALIEGRPLTTKGRWLNPLVFGLFRLIQCLPYIESAKKPIYIVGTGRSGTTVLGTLFALHHQTAFLNEPKAMWHYAIGNEDLIGSYGKEPGNFRIQATSLAAERIAKIYSLTLIFSFANRVVDKYPELIFRVNPITKMFEGAKFICIIRDGVDACSSVKIWSQKKAVIKTNETYDWWGRNDQKWSVMVEQLVPEHEDLKGLQSKLKMTSDHCDRAAVEWILSMREVLRLSSRSERLLTVRYENLCKEPRGTIKSIFSHCNLDEDEAVYRYANRILNVTPSYSKIEIMKELFPIFVNTLEDMGYQSSISRVIARA